MESARVSFLALLLVFLPIRTSQAASCDDVLAPGHAYSNYNAVWEELKDGHEPQSIENIDCFLPGDLTGIGSEVAYRRFISTSFYPNVPYDYLKQAADETLRKARKQGQHREAELAWNGGYTAEAALTAYRKTGDRRFLDLFVTYFDGVLKLRDSELGYVDDYHGRVMKSWGEYRGGSSPKAPGKWVAHITHAARITYPATEFALIVRNDPALVAYRDDADRFVEATKDALAEFEEDRFRIEGTDWYWFRRPMSGEAEATNHIHTYGSLLLNLYALTGDEQLKQRIKDIIEVFEKGVRWEPDGTVSWKYLPYFSNRGAGSNQKEYSERLWKASQTVPFLYRAYAAGFDVPASLIKAITTTFLTYTLHDNQIMRNLTSKHSRPLTRNDPLERVSGIVTWLEYSDYDPEIADRIREVVGVRPDLFPDGWFESANSARGYAFFLGGTRD
jgi:hypothetical protein